MLNKRNGMLIYFEKKKQKPSTLIFQIGLEINKIFYQHAYLAHYSKESYVVTGLYHFEATKNRFDQKVVM